MFKNKEMNIIGAEILKEYYELSEFEISLLNSFEDFVISCLVNEIYFNIMILTDTEQELIIKSSEYARIHKRSL